MGSSHLYQMNEIVELIFFAMPNSVLDVGVGFGKYGYLAREYLELWDGRKKYNDWKKIIDGIEACQEYITPRHKLIYNNIYIGDALNIIHTIKQNYDLILLIDIFEHFSYEEGVKFLHTCEKMSRNIIISTPINIGHQLGSDNPYQTHKFQWRKKHFHKICEKPIFFVPNDYSYICFIGDDTPNVMKKVKFRRNKLRRLIINLLEFFHLRYPLKHFWQKIKKINK